MMTPVALVSWSSDDRSPAFVTAARLAPMVTETDLALPGGRVLHVYDTGGPARSTVFWHHGTPNTGAPPGPLLPLAEQLGVRWVSFDRPGYGTSTPVPGRTAG